MKRSINTFYILENLVLILSIAYARIYEVSTS